MSWLTAWLKRGIGFSMDPPKILDGSFDKCQLCQQTREKHRMMVHRFMEAE